MTYSTDNFVRRAVGGLLRGDYAGKFVCAPCLVTLTHQYMQRGWRTLEIERSMDAVFQSPGALMCIPTLICTICQKTRPCLGTFRS